MSAEENVEHSTDPEEVDMQSLVLNASSNSGAGKGLVPKDKK
jgi:hypothetical protein